MSRQRAVRSHRLSGIGECCRPRGAVAVRAAICLRSGAYVLLGAQVIVTVLGYSLS